MFTGRSILCRANFTALSALGLLSACAAGPDYPSLKIRNAERMHRGFSSPPALSTPPEPTALNADLATRLAQLQGQAETAHAAFMQAQPGAAKLVNAARGAVIESDQWASAQVALAGLESSRSAAAVPLGDLDTLYTEAALAFTQREKIEQARGAVTAMLGEEDHILASLRGKLAS